MDERTVSISELDGEYRIENNGIAEFALLGILECIVFDMKAAHREARLLPRGKPPIGGQELQKQKVVLQQQTKEVVAESNTPDIRTRISNAVKAIKGLGGEAKDNDRSSATEEELQTELEELTEQYKRLKNSKKTK
jgi:hypothetical protein